MQDLQQWLTGAAKAAGETNTRVMITSEIMRRKYCGNVPLQQQMGLRSRAEKAI